MKVEGSWKTIVSGMSAILVLSLFLAVSGCGSDELVSNPESVKRDGKLDARLAVEEFYEQIDRSDFASAWEKLSPSARNELGSLDDWRRGHAGRISTELRDTWVEKRDPGRYLVHVDLRTLDSNRCGVSSEQFFSGTWRVRSIGGEAQLTNPDIYFVRGKDPVLAAERCEKARAERRLARTEARRKARQRRLLVKQSATDAYGIYDSEGSDRGYSEEVNPTPQRLDGSTSYEFEADDIDRAESASHRVKDYCSGAVSEAQYVG